jgi:energy-coupling factor transporter ATP-binding protein EcfA2
MTSETPTHHLLRQLVFPARYEALSNRLGAEVARLLVPPAQQTLDALRRVSLSAANRSEGYLVPVFGPSGAGKTTLANNASTFLPGEYSTTVVHTGAVTFEALLASATAIMNTLAANDRRPIPINVDHRESAPPSAEELASIKRFAREPRVGHRCLVMWPETSPEIGRRIGDSYADIAGVPPIELPLQVDGPDRETWVDIALHTLEISNDLSSLEQVGVDPRDYDPGKYPSLGAFLADISRQFIDHIHDLIVSTQKTLGLIIVFASESPNAGVLAQLTSSTHYGLVDGHALVAATSDSEVGKWWAARPGLLTQTIVRLDCRALCLPPPASVRILRRFGSEEVRDMLADVGVSRPGQELIDSIDRSDLGKFLSGTARSTFEARGTPSTTATPAFQLLASEYGFSAGRDKLLNRGITDGLEYYYKDHELTFDKFQCELGLRFCPLIPDISVVQGDHVACLELCWRSGDHLTTGNRSATAQYMLTKLRNYAREMGWAQT